MILIACAGSTKQLRRRRVEFINFIPQRAKCHVSTFCISKISQLSNIMDTDWPFRFIAEGFDVCLAGTVSKAVVKMFSHLLDDTL